MLTLKTTDLRLFWTAYDPLDLASGSIDVLGFQGGYISLANKLLPGFTTVTTSPRYVSMLCAAIAAAEAEFSATGDATLRVRQARLAAVKSYERAWALACGLAASDAEIGDEAVDGLRGVQYVRRRLAELTARERSIRTSSFNLLANQVRYGGIGAYSTLMEDCHLATMRSVTLRALGARLADSFPRPEGELPVWDENRSLSLDALRAWGVRCHLGKFTREEAHCVATALQGGEEGGWEDDVRWSALRMLAAFQEDGVSEPDLLNRLLNAIQDGGFNCLESPRGCMQQIEAALVLIRPYERLYQAAQFLFDAVRAAATDEPDVHPESLASTPLCISAHQGARAAASDLLTAIDSAGTIHPQTAHDVRGAFLEAGVGPFAETTRGLSNGADLIGLILDRHRDVQQGKFDRGQQKAAWVRRDPTTGLARLTTQRHLLPRSGRYDRWDQIPWHPYRTYGALRFVKACGIN